MEAAAPVAGVAFTTGDPPEGIFIEVKLEGKGPTADAAVCSDTGTGPEDALTYNTK